MHVLTVLDIESIEDSPSVSNEQFGLRGVRIDGHAAKVNERASVGGALVVHPDHASLVFAVTRDMIDNVLLACKNEKPKHRRKQ